VNGTAEPKKNTGQLQVGLKEKAVPGTKNVIKPTFIDPQKVLLPSLHIKLGIMKQYAKALEKSRPCYQ
jgi:hypothetical protein